MIHCDICGKENAKNIKIIVDEKENIVNSIKTPKSIIANLHVLPCDLCVDCQKRIMQTIKDMIIKPEAK